MAQKQTFREKKADRFTSTKEDTAKGKYRTEKGRKAADDIRRAMKNK